MNVADSDLLIGILAGAGYRRVERADQADVVVVNTCAVRDKAEAKVLGRAHELGALQRKRPAMVLAIVGCMAEHLKSGLAAAAPVDVIAGPDSYRRLPDLLATARAARVGATATSSIAPVVDVRLDKDETYEGLSTAEGTDGVSGFVTIQRGCDKFCTFCVVPFTRGRERGTSPREVLRQVRELVARGVMVVVLLGQTVNS
jgi:tRNA-2-methylthio-N6-dimethylallyladenosine synthase